MADRGHDRLASNDLQFRAMPKRVRADADDCRIELTGQQPLDQFIGVALGQGDLNLRVPPAEFREHARHIHVVRGHGAHCEMTTEQSGQLGKGEPDAVDGGQCRACIGEHRRASLGQPDDPSAAVQQVLAKFTLEVRHGSER